MPAPACELQVAEKQELVLLSRTDSLTGLLNRRELMEELERAIERTTRNRASSAVLFLDPNNSKYINDTQGHDAGDRVLKKLRAALCRATHSYDFVVRLGADEYVLWFENGDKETALCRAVAILASSRMLAEEVSLDPAKNLELSIGIAIFNADHPESAHKLMLRADDAMYHAKNNNKKNIAIACH
jgi:diguanylate cyclase (GGDEF)-like protein